MGRREQCELQRLDVFDDATPPAGPVAGRTPHGRWIAPLLLAAVVAAAAIVVSWGDGDPSSRPAPSTTSTATTAVAVATRAPGLVGSPPSGYGPGQASALRRSSRPPFDVAVLWAAGRDARSAWVYAVLATDAAALDTTAVPAPDGPPTALGAIVAAGTHVETGVVPGGYATVATSGLTPGEAVAVLRGLRLDPATREGYASADGSVPAAVHLRGTSRGVNASTWMPSGLVVYRGSGAVAPAISVLAGPPPSLFQTVLEQFFLVDSLPAIVDGRPAFTGVDWISGLQQVVFDRDGFHVVASSSSWIGADLTAFARTVRRPTTAEWTVALDEPR